MASSDITQLKRLVSLQGKQIAVLTGKIAQLEKNIAQVPNVQAKPESVEQVAAVEEKIELVVSGPENPTNMFKVFGIIGAIMIVLGVIYFYNYAVDQGWIGITGRIAIGMIASIIVIGIGIFMNNKGYANFSQLLLSIGLGIMYFTVYATYHFKAYKEALGMSLTLNTILLICVMAGGLFIGTRFESKWVLYGSILLGYLAAFLAGIEGQTIHILLYVLVIDIILLVFARIQKIYMGIPGQVITYIAYLIWYAQAIFSPSSVVAQTDYPVFVTFFFLILYYALFTILQFIQSSDHKENQAVAISVINTVALAGIGLGIVSKYVSEFNGLYIMAVAALTLALGYFAKKQKFELLFDVYFLLTIILVAIAIPVQFDNTIVTVLWAVMALGLAYAGMKIEHERLFNVGYIGFVIPALRVICYDLWFLDRMERFITIPFVIASMILVQMLLAKRVGLEKSKSLMRYNIFSLVWLMIATIWIAREIMSIENSSMQFLNVLLSIAWAIGAVISIWYGVAIKRKLFNWFGVVLFGIVIFKVLIIDLSSMENIFKVIALIVVGTLALIGSFVFVKNREKIKEFM